ncbi:hypothetical protein LXL04_039170 [Taraxacum kok-saghyz]
MHQYSEYLGGEINRDAYHMNDPPSDGLDVSSCIQASLEDAGVSAEDVNYINARATSALVGDPAEVNAVKEVFRNTVGHYFGAAGGLEAIATVKAIQGTSMKVLHFESPLINMQQPFFVC